MESIKKRNSKNQAMFSGKVHRAALYTRASVIVPLKAAVERAQLVEWIIKTIGICFAQLPGIESDLCNNSPPSPVWTRRQPPVYAKLRSPLHTPLDVCCHFPDPSPSFSGETIFPKNLTPALNPLFRGCFTLLFFPLNFL